MEVRDLGFSYDGGPPLIDGLTFAVGRRDRIGVIGKNGKGKTTLLELLAGELAPLEGRGRPFCEPRDRLFRSGEYRPPERELDGRRGDHPGHARSQPRRCAEHLRHHALRGRHGA